MAKHRRADSKVALGQQRAELRQGSRHKRFVGDDAGEVTGHAAELAKVRQMRAEAQRRDDAQQRESVEAAASLAGAEGWAHPREEREERDRRSPYERAREASVSELVRELVADSFRLTRTLIAFPFRIAAALRGRRPSMA
jgi:hypothetical protein